MPKKKHSRRHSRRHLTTNIADAHVDSQAPKRNVGYKGFDISTVQEKDSSVVTIQTKVRYPINGNMNPMHYQIHESHLWTDLWKSSIVMRIKLVKPAGGDFTGQEKIGLINNMAFSIFKHLVVTINDQQIGISSEGDFPFLQWFKNILTANDEYERTLGTLRGWKLDRPAQHIDAATDDNVGWKDRNEGLEDSGIIELELPLNQLDLFSVRKSFPPLVKIDLSFTPGNPTFYTHGLACTLVHVEEPILMTHHTIGDPSVLLPIETRLSQTTAEFRFRGWTLHKYQIPANITQHGYNLVTNGKMPRWFALALTYVARFNGTIGTTPFKFGKYNLATVEVDGDAGKEITHANKLADRMKNYTRYMNQRLVAGNVAVNAPDIPRDLWEATIPFHITDVTPDEGLSPDVYFPRPDGSLRINLTFSQAPTAPLQVLIFAVHDSCVRFDMNGSIEYKLDM